MVRFYSLALAGLAAAAPESAPQFHGFKGPDSLGGRVLTTPKNDCGKFSSLETYTWATGVHEPRRCFHECMSWNREHPVPNYRECRFFNTYMVEIDGKSKVQQCSLYTQRFEPYFLWNVIPFQLGLPDATSFSESLVYESDKYESVKNYTTCVIDALPPPGRESTAKRSADEQDGKEGSPVRRQSLHSRRVGRTNPA